MRFAYPLFCMHGNKKCKFVEYAGLMYTNMVYSSYSLVFRGGTI